MIHNNSLFRMLISTLVWWSFFSSCQLQLMSSVMLIIFLLLWLRIEMSDCLVYKHFICRLSALRSSHNHKMTVDKPFFLGKSMLNNKRQFFKSFQRWLLNISSMSANSYNLSMRKDNFLRKCQVEFGNLFFRYPKISELRTTHGAQFNKISNLICKA